MWRVIGEIEEKRLQRLRLRAKEFHTPFREEFCRMSSRVNGVKPAAHIVVVVPEVRVVVVHHIAEEAVKMIEPSPTWVIFGFKSEMPLADKRGVVIPPLKHGGKRDSILSEVTPTVFSMRPNHTRHAYPIRKAACHERSAAR